MPKRNTVALSQAIEFFTVIEKPATRGCFKIIWRRIQHMALKYFDEGSYFNNVDLLYVIKYYWCS